MHLNRALNNTNDLWESMCMMELSKCSSCSLAMFNNRLFTNHLHFCHLLNQQSHYRTCHLKEMCPHQWAAHTKPNWFSSLSSFVMLISSRLTQTKNGQSSEESLELCVMCIKWVMGWISEIACFALLNEFGIRNRGCGITHCYSLANWAQLCRALGCECSQLFSGSTAALIM